MTSAINGRPTYTAEFLKGDWDKSVFLGNPHVDNLMTAFLNLGGEYWALRRRLMVVEKLLASRCGIDATQIETYHPSDAEQRDWDQKRDEFIQRVFAVLVRDVGDMSGPIDAGRETLRPPRTTEDAL